MAIKVIDRRRLIANPDLVTEVNVLKKLSHPNIVRLIDVFITPENLQIVMELYVAPLHLRAPFLHFFGVPHHFSICRAGQLNAFCFFSPFNFLIINILFCICDDQSCEGHELFDEIVDRRTFSEVDARDLIREILEPLAYLHAQGIAHRDLKPENIMFVSEEDTKHIKLLDFGFAKAVTVDSTDVSMVGTLGYKAPEIFKKEPYSTKCDMWALGVIAYILLCGFPPFFSEEHYKDMVNNAPFWFFFNDETPLLIDQIKRGSVSYPDSHWSRLSPQAKSFVQSLLLVDPAKRATAREALNHPWMSWKPSPFNNGADLAIKTPTLMQRLRDGGGVNGTLGPAAARPRIAISDAFISSFTTNPMDAIRNRVERHILGESRGVSFSAEWERTDVDDEDETLQDVKYRLLASYDTQEAQLEMLSALDQDMLHKYLRQRRGSLGSRPTRPRRTHQRKLSI